MRQRALPDDRASPIRPLLSLSLVPAGNGFGLRYQRSDRSGQHRGPQRRGGDHRHPVREWPGAEDPPLSGIAESPFGATMRAPVTASISSGWARWMIRNAYLRTSTSSARRSCLGYRYRQTCPRYPSSIAIRTTGRRRASTATKPRDRGGRPGPSILSFSSS